VPSRDEETTLQMIVLGAMASGPGTTREVQKRLADVWPGAKISRNIAHTVLPRLVERGYLRVVEEGEKPRATRYELIDAGVVRLREWVPLWPSEVSHGDELHVKALFATLEDLPEIVRMAESRADARTAEAEKTQSKLLGSERLLAKVPPRTVEEEFQAELRKVVLEDVTRRWEDLAASSRLFSESVDEVYRRFAGRRPPGEG
jgi:DNA-binding PadR family transcriptional regulator